MRREESCGAPLIRRPPVALLRAATSFGLWSRLSLPQPAALGRHARPSVSFFDRRIYYPSFLCFWQALAVVLPKGLNII